LLAAAEQRVEAGRFRHAGADRVDADMPSLRSSIQLRAKLRTAAFVAE
jgi:hypothetical protein